MKRITEETRENLEKGTQEPLPPPKKVIDEHSRYCPFGVRFVTLKRIHT
jgi:hypothetical protein